MGLNVVVAEANEELAETVCSYLRARECEVHVARSGVECLERLRQFSPQVLVLDLELLWGGGSGVLACLRESNNGYCPAVVLTTTPRNEQHLTRFAPVVDYLVKPFALASLLQCIERAVQSPDFDPTQSTGRRTGPMD